MKQVFKSILAEEYGSQGIENVDELAGIAETYVREHVLPEIVSDHAEYGPKEGDVIVVIPHDSFNATFGTPYHEMVHYGDVVMGRLKQKWTRGGGIDRYRHDFYQGSINVKGEHGKYRVRKPLDVELEYFERAELFMKHGRDYNEFREGDVVKYSDEDGDTFIGTVVSNVIDKTLVETTCRRKWLHKDKLTLVCLNNQRIDHEGDG